MEYTTHIPLDWKSNFKRIWNWQTVSSNGNWEKKIVSVSDNFFCRCKSNNFIFPIFSRTREIFKPREQPPAPPITTFIIRRRCNGQETLISQNGFQFFLSTNCRLLTEEEKLNPVEDFTDWELSQNPFFNGVMERGENFRIVGRGGRCVVDQDSDSDDWGGRVDTDDSDSSGW